MDALVEQTDVGAVIARSSGVTLRTSFAGAPIMTEPSAMRSPCTPYTRSDPSTTDMASVPIFALQD